MFGVCTGLTALLTLALKRSGGCQLVTIVENGKSASMIKRDQGSGLDEIPEVEQVKLVDLMWNVPKDDIMIIEDIFHRDEDWVPENLGFVKWCG